METFYFDSSSAPKREVISEGENDGIIVACEVKRTNSGTGRFVEIKTEFGKILIISRFNIENPSAKAVEIGAQELRECFISAFGADRKCSVDELVNKPVRCMLEKKPNLEGKQYLEITRWLPRVNSATAQKKATPPAAQKPTTPSTASKGSEDDVPFN